MGHTSLIPTLHLPWKSRETTDHHANHATLMEEFEKHFDDLVDVLCWSAKEGDHEGRDEQYASVRAWFLRNYEPLRPILMKHLSAEPEDVVPCGPGQPTPRDAFESLFLPTDVDLNINSDTVIFRIIRTRCAVDALRSEISTWS